MSVAVLFLLYCHLVIARHALVKNDEYPVEHQGQVDKAQAQIVKRQRFGLPETTISSWTSSQVDSLSSNFSIAMPSTVTNNAVPLYVFPSTVIQVAVATLCPYNISANSSGPFTSTHTSGFGNLTYITTSAGPTPTLLNATGTSVNGSVPTTTATNNSTSGTDPHVGFNLTIGVSDRTGQDDGSDVNLNIARIVQGDDNCQTIYAPQTITSCSTTVTLAGLPPVSVTDCDQWITFSTAGAPACSAFPMAPTAPTPSAPPTPFAPPTPQSSPNINDAIIAPQKLAPALALHRRDASPANASVQFRPSNLLTTVHDTIYYVAHWWDLLSNHIPSIVRVEDCAEGHIGDACAAHTETWVLGSKLQTTTGTSVIAYTGPVVFTYGMWTFNTTVAIDTTVTTTGTLTIPTISRGALALSEPTSTSLNLTSSVESTVTLSVSVPTTKTWTLEPIPPRTSTITRDTTITVTTTVYPTTSVQG